MREDRHTPVPSMLEATSRRVAWSRVPRGRRHERALDLDRRGPDTRRSGSRDRQLPGWRAALRRLARPGRPGDEQVRVPQPDQPRLSGLDAADDHGGRAGLARDRRAGMVSARASSVIEVQPHLPGLVHPHCAAAGAGRAGPARRPCPRCAFSACPASMCTSTRSRYLFARTRGAPRIRRNGRLLRTPGTCRSGGPPIP